MNQSTCNMSTSRDDDRCTSIVFATAAACFCLISQISSGMTTGGKSRKSRFACSSNEPIDTRLEPRVKRGRRGSPFSRTCKIGRQATIDSKG
jgi:hypothetical protein